MNVEIGAEAAHFPEKEYINGIAVAVGWLWSPLETNFSVALNLFKKLIISYLEIIFFLQLN
jgi:hypothetical protein